MWAALVLLAVALAILISPMRLRLKLTAQPAARFRAWLRVLGGLSPPIPVFDSAWTFEGKAKPERPEKKKRAKIKPSRVSRAAAAAPECASGFLRRIKLECVDVAGEFGLADPADTGVAYGMIAPWLYAAPRSARRRASLIPAFDGPHLSGEGDVRLRFTPVAFLPVVFRAIWRVFVR